MRVFTSLILLIITDPKSAISKLLALNLSAIIVVQGVLFVNICGSILTSLFWITYPSNIVVESSVSMPLPEKTIMLISTFEQAVRLMKSIQPFHFVTEQIFLTILFAVSITLGGRLFGGKGNFFEALICITLVKSILVLLKVFEIVLLPISLVLAVIVLTAGIIWSLWAVACIAAFIHNFKSTLLTFCGGFALSVLFLYGLIIFN